MIQFEHIGKLPSKEEMESDEKRFLNNLGNKKDYFEKHKGCMIFNHDMPKESLDFGIYHMDDTGDTGIIIEQLNKGSE